MDGFDQHVPEIERRIAELKPHAIVLGLGPSAYLLPKVNPALLKGVRLFGVNDAFRIMPVHDLVVMDGPENALHPKARGEQVIKSTPDRFWIYANCWKPWHNELPQEMHARCRMFQLRVLHPMDFDNMKANPPKLANDTIDHIAVSPAGTTQIAWREGCRRIGVIGVDLLPGNHKLATDHYRYVVDWFFWQLGEQSRLLRGDIRQLSPFSMLPNFERVSWPVREKAAS